VVDRGRRHVPGCWRSTGYMVIADLCPGSDAVYLPMPSPFRLLTNTALVLAMLPLGAHARAEPAPEHALAQAEPAPEHVLTQAEPAPEHVLTQAEPAPEHVLVDMQVWLAPPQPQGYCVQLEPGTLSVQLEAVGHGEDGQGEPGQSASRSTATAASIGPPRSRPHSPRWVVWMRPRTSRAVTCIASFCRTWSRSRPTPATRRSPATGRRSMCAWPSSRRQRSVSFERALLSSGLSERTKSSRCL
jgi:hypothetical protein